MFCGDILAMNIKSRPTKKKKAKFIHGVEQEIEKKFGRFPQLNKFYLHRRIYGF